ncbi:helix-hairpin-helix domain-containing protein [Maribacter sp. MMG018]|uniref:ComEA family DNA-binding protein n=1 Tax=Maribacter sp. MMG018 TaxID=2822688 RepID=UPI001B37B749|nr:helix-hairpin-helix domain-containing protein [Maribacter sp. MMG018]MBQ4916203.1 helix-hairpin-helix domain-containing protein [Maribacter sp. MMG018]
MKKIKSHFKFNKQERSGIFFLLLLLVLIQFGYWVYQKSYVSRAKPITLDKETQLKVDFLKEELVKKKKETVYSFNPNFISDFKGYNLGMSVDEIDRLHNFRAEGKFVNSKEEFQKVTFVSDSLLDRISTRFKFPEWAKNKKKVVSANNKVKTKDDFVKGYEIKDLNEATREDLMSINGIGEKLSARILKFRDRLGGFLIEDQLYDVYGLEGDVVRKVFKRFRVLNAPFIEKLDINTASVGELSKIVYIQKHVAQGIVDYRNLNGSIHSFEELTKIKDFPVNRIERIPLYLSLKK